MLAGAGQFAHERHTLGRVQFHPNLVEIHSAAQSLDQCSRLGGVLKIERDNDGVPAHRMRIGFPDFSITRPMRYALGKVALQLSRVLFWQRYQ